MFTNETTENNVQVEVEVEKETMEHVHNTTSQNAGNAGNTRSRQTGNAQGIQKIQRINGSSTLTAIKEINDTLMNTQIILTEIKSTSTTTVRWPGALIRIKDFPKQIAVIFPTEGVKLSHLKNDPSQLLAADAFDRLYRGAVIEAGGNVNEEIITVLSINEDKKESIIRLINGLVDEYNDDADVFTYAKLDPDTIISTTIEFTGDTKTVDSMFPITRQFKIDMTTVKTNGGSYSIHDQANQKLTFGGYTRPVFRQVTEQVTNEQGYLIPQTKLKYDNNFIINSMDVETKTINQLLISLLGMMAMNASFYSILGWVAANESPDLAGIELLSNPDIGKENPIHALRPDDLAVRLDNLYTSNQTISVEVALATLPELYSKLNDIYRNVPAVIAEFEQAFETTFGVAMPENFPIFTPERVEFPVGVIPTETETPLTSLSPSRVFIESSDEPMMLKLMNAELGIAEFDKTAMESYISVLGDLVGDGIIYERGLRYQFSHEFVELVLRASSNMNVEANNKFLTQPSLKLNFVNHVNDNSVPLHKLVGNRFNSQVGAGGYKPVGSHRTFQQR